MRLLFRVMLCKCSSRNSHMKMASYREEEGLGAREEKCGMC
jgi:hypothetical protein